MLKSSITQIGKSYNVLNSAREEVSKSQLKLLDNTNYKGSVPSLASTEGIRSEGDYFILGFFQRIMQRIISKLANVGHYFHSDYQRLSTNDKSQLFLTTSKLIPKLDDESYSLAMDILEMLPAPVAGISGDATSVAAVEKLVHFIGVAVVRMAESSHLVINGSRAKKEAVKLLRNLHHPGIEFLIYLQAQAVDEAKFVNLLIARASDVGRMNLEDMRSEKYYHALESMALLWGCLLGERSKEVPIQRAYNYSPDIFN